MDEIEEPHRPWGRAVVIGAGFAGLLAARVLADHFAEVVVVERDRLEDETAFRGGVPQSRHLHLLLSGGARVVEELFPGLRQELSAAGAPVFDHGEGILMMLPGGWAPRLATGITAQSFSRNLLESRILRRVRTLPNVEIRDGLAATGLIMDGRRRRIDALGVIPRARRTSAAYRGQDLDADLFVDATGRTSRLADWLCDLGYPRPPETVVDAGMGYASCVYEAVPLPGDGKMIHEFAQAPHHRRGGVLEVIEGGRCIVSLHGLAGDHPPTDEDGFLAFAKTLRSPFIVEALLSSRRLTPIYRYARTENRRIAYHRLRRWPDRIVALGDAHCVFNPIYGQGMTVAGIGVMALRKALDRRRASAELTGLARSYQRTLSRSTMRPWLMSSSVDYRWAVANGGRRSPLSSLGSSCVHGLFHAATYDPDLYRNVLRVFHMIESPATLLRPGVLAQVVRWSGRPHAATDDH